MNRLMGLFASASVASLIAGGTAGAALLAGATAPSFTAQASLGGNTFTFDLHSALRKGPVVLYFYPAAFTTGCTLEAHDFATHIDAYAKLHATVIGVSVDDISTLQRFSVSECRGKFAVAADADAKIARAYDALLDFNGKTLANRTSYVIGQDGKIAYTYTSLNFEKHVANTLNALRQLRPR